MRALLHKLLILAGIAYAVSLPVSLLVGGVLFSRPIRSPVSVDSIREHCDETWTTAFLTESRAVKIKVEPNVRLAATIFGGYASRCVVILHELGDNRTDVLAPAYALWRNGIDVVLVDRRAHGNSDGESQPLFGGEPKDIAALVDQLVNNDWCGTAKIGLFGVGDAGVSCLLAAAADPRIDAVAAEDAVPSAFSYIGARLEGWAGIPSELLFAQTFLAEIGMKFLGGASTADLDVGEPLRGLEAPTMLVNNRDGKRRSLGRQLEPKLVNASIHNASDDVDYAELAAFFKQNL